MQLSTFIPRVTIICWWISQCSKVTNLWIFCYQGYIERTPVPWHFGDLARTCPRHSIQDSVLDIPLRTIIEFRNIGGNCQNHNCRLTIRTSLDGEWWVILFGSLNFFFMCTFLECCMYWLRVLVVYFSTGIRWLIGLRPGNLLLINFWNNFGIRNNFGCSINCSIKFWW